MQLPDRIGRLSLPKFLPKTINEIYTNLIFGYKKPISEICNFTKKDRK